MRREETASRIRARKLERASTASTRTRAKSRTGTNAREKSRHARTHVDARGSRERGGDGDGDDVEIVEIVRAVDDGRFEASRDVDERWVERGRGRGGTRRDDETASRGRVGV